WQTSAVVSALVLDSRYGLDRGFEVYDDDLSAGVAASDFMMKETDAANTTERALLQLQELGVDPWFLWVHYFDPHASYDPPARFSELCPSSPYDAEIAYVDSELGRLLQWLEDQNLAEDTLVVLTSDHGESHGEHGESTHGFFLYDATTRVPLIFHHPRSAFAAKKVVTGVAGLVDLAPTVLDWAFGDASEHSLLEAIRTGHSSRVPVEQESMVPFLNHGWADLRALRGEHERYVRAPRPEFYDLKEDPNELQNLFSTEGVAGVDRLQKELVERIALQGEKGRGFSLPREMSPEERAAMEALGYVWDVEALPSDEDLADPKDRVSSWELNQRVYAYVAVEQWGAAESLLRQQISEAPSALDPRKTLARVLSEVGRAEEALAELQFAASLPAADTDLFLRLATQLERAGGDWRPALLEAKLRNPLDPEPWIRQGDWVRKGSNADLGAASKAYLRALEIDPQASSAWLGLGRVQMITQDLDGAQVSLTEARRWDASSAEAWFASGIVALKAGLGAEAAAFFEGALERKPEHPGALVNLANMHFQNNRVEEAERLYQKALISRPGHLQASLNYSTLLLETDRPQRALQLLEEAKGGGDHPGILALRARAEAAIRG
ncbi:MAG: sulfatase-like hydrolase/transferase, partial [Planctomycetes bacterium]|nr:sulfatase-like hydrolase/transferase [Planctomycetota bacterium]